MLGRGHTSAQGELVRAEQLECDLIHFGVTYNPENLQRAGV